MVPEITIRAVLLATASSMVVGAIGYSHLAFGTSWMTAVGHDEESLRTGSTAITGRSRHRGERGTQKT
ncbi:DUF1761 family protein [Cryobacterium sp. Hz7]|uniref:DUF1761 domain-containing protein n=1 Tax=Cryobacterium sp. Hz7 TaxID=1259166 RepID=UPI00106BAA51|nr:DUF1761 domain-containing protein [Cryobacterium sp. Hz7]TFB62729.1 DUF1761 family protein [Cryobacterium sp. Hz7]